jgi:hypothetical protein
MEDITYEFLNKFNRREADDSVNLFEAEMLILR